MAKRVAPERKPSDKRPRGIVARATDPSSLPPHASSAGDAIDETLWALADEALAIAWREALVLDNMLERSASAKPPPTPAAARSACATSGQSLLVVQALARAASLRGLTILSAPGARVPYDPLLHDLERGSARPGQLVRIRAPAVIKAAAPGRSQGQDVHAAKDAPARTIVKAVATAAPRR